MLRLFQRIAPPFAHHYGVRFNYRPQLGIATCECRDGGQPDPVPYHERVLAMHKSWSSQALQDHADLHLRSHNSMMERIQSGHEKAFKDLQDSFEVAMNALKKMDQDREQEQLNEIQDMRDKCEHLEGQCLEIDDEKMRLEHNFNIRGALERIVYRSGKQKFLLTGAGMQQGLDAIAAEESFKAVLEKEVQVRGLKLEMVKDCVHNLYHEVSKHAHGNDGTILVRAVDFTPNERAALAAFLTLQSTWKNALIWREIGLPDKGKEVL